MYNIKSHRWLLMYHHQLTLSVVTRIRSKLEFVFDIFGVFGVHSFNVFGVDCDDKS